MAAKRRHLYGRSKSAELLPQGSDSIFQSLGRIEVVLLVGGVLLLLVLFYTINTILSPFLVLGAIIFLLFPLRRYSLARNVMWLSVMLFSLWLLSEISDILAPFVVGMVFAYILDPIVDFFERWKIPRWVSSLVLILFLLGSIVLVLFFVLPVAASQVEGFLQSTSQLVADFRTYIQSSTWLTALERYGISSEEIRTTITSRLTPKLEDVLKTGFQGFLQLVSSLSRVVTQVFYVFLVPFLTFYILTDFPKIAYRFTMLFPRQRRERTKEYMKQADDLIGRYLRGALRVALLQGIAIFIAFTLFDIKYALLLALLASILDLIPYFGLIVIMLLSGIVATFSDPPVLPKVLFALGTIGLFHIVEVVFLSPRIVGSKVGLHPLLIILSLLVFFQFLGFVGLLIAVPVTALTILFVRDWEKRKHGFPPPESELSVPY
ncbi:MAG: AI-2E family transporter [Ignavibacteriales bacterium]|nr:AI-2E family transporter [Ignavibacteriales bacterium]